MKEVISAKLYYLVVRFLVRFNSKIRTKRTEVFLRSLRYVRHKSAFIHLCTGELDVILKSSSQVY